MGSPFFSHANGTLNSGQRHELDQLAESPSSMVWEHVYSPSLRFVLRRKMDSSEANRAAPLQLFIDPFFATSTFGYHEFGFSFDSGNPNFPG